MSIWSRRDPRNKFRIFLKHLDSNFYDDNKRTVAYLRKPFYPYSDKLISQFVKEGLVNKKKQVVEITFKGYEFLDKLRISDINNERLKREQEKMLLEAFGLMSIALAVFGNLTQNIIFKWVVGIAVLIVIFILAYRILSYGKFIKRDVTG